MDIMKLARFLEEMQYFPENISFRDDWLGWKLVYCDALLYMHESQKDVVKNLAKHAAEHENHKLVFRTSGNVFCDYVYLFVNDSENPELPYFMLNRNEIFEYYDDFLERLSIKGNSIVFRTDSGIYRFDDYEWLIEEYGDDARDVFLEEEFWRYIYSGHFDPLPLTEEVDVWRRKVIRVHRDVPRV
ncbi:hypothetical protein Ferp_0432 [Ferroglobus placidus DSM 10642]|uniref:Uncharacterized protein n=1 Tax=Ferroglobus placidus (strain DSM 10642 / AEDII12DO) TaxID=589924 RepID=D3S2X4_FERPA|nr:hypothetical protein [Ferroglobus placidus]ADC64607.1 hypothetical protein Ferp_0432 [Ferroglobus placidus DSM 10642]